MPLDLKAWKNIIDSDSNGVHKYRHSKTVESKNETGRQTGVLWLSLFVSR